MGGSQEHFDLYAVYIYDAAQRAYVICNEYEQKAYAFERGIVVAADKAKAAGISNAPMIIVGIDSGSNADYTRKMKRPEVEQIGTITHEQTIDVKKVLQEAYGADDEIPAASTKPPRQQGTKRGRAVAIVILIFAVIGFYKVFFGGSGHSNAPQEQSSAASSDDGNAQQANSGNITKEEDAFLRLACRTIHQMVTICHGPNAISVIQQFMYPPNTDDPQLNQANAETFQETLRDLSNAEAHGQVALAMQIQANVCLNGLMNDSPTFGTASKREVSVFASDYREIKNDPLYDKFFKRKSSEEIDRDPLCN